jgi:hypothetical protein
VAWCRRAIDGWRVIAPVGRDARPPVTKTTATDDRENVPVLPAATQAEAAVAALLAAGSASAARSTP